MIDYEQLRAALDKKIAADPSLRAVMKRVKNGTATLTDSAEYARSLSHILGREVSASVLELDDRESAVTQLLHDSYDDVNSIYAQTQSILDEQAGIHINPKKPPFPAERVKQFAHSLIDPTVKDSVIKRRARAGTETITKSFHDNCIKVNAQFRHDAGLKCYIVRIGTKCCEWCTEVAGKYKFGEQPDGIFRRHDNCDCTIIYDGQVLRGKQNADGSRSKTWEELPNANAADYTAPTFSEAEGRAIEQQNLAQIRGIDFSSKPGKDSSAIANMDFINSDSYAKKFEGKYENEDVENAVVAACRQIIKNRDGTFFEEAYFIDSHTGETISYVKGKKRNGINMPEKLKKRLTKAPKNSIIMVHNHPNSSPLSTDDYKSSTKYESLFEVLGGGHNGDVYAFRNTYGTEGSIVRLIDGTEDYEAIRDFRLTYSKYIERGVEDFEARHLSWTAVMKNRGFQYERR